MRRLLRPAPALAALLAAATPAQQVAFPHRVGHLTPGPGWTVLGAADLAAAERASDPAAEPARGVLRAVIAELQSRQRAAEHVLLHAAGPHGALRLVNAYTAPVHATGAALREPAAAARMRQALEPELARGGAKVTFLGDDDPGLFRTGSTRLRFLQETAAGTFRLDHHAVPAGDRVVYFETIWTPGDAEAEAAIAAVVRTFDGARDSLADPMLRNLMLGAVLGGGAGVLMALWRRRRLLRQLQASSGGR